MSKYYIEVPNGGLATGRTVEADYADVEFGILKFYDKSSGNIVAAFSEWNNFRPDEEVNI